MAEVPATATPVTLDTAAYALLTAARAQGLSLTRVGALLFLALVWVETGRGKSTIQHNVGNVMARGYRTNGVEYSVWSGDYWRPAWFNDTSSATYQRMLNGQAPSAFRAYDSLVDGMADYVAVLFGKSGLVQAANSGDVSAFVDVLSRTYSPDYGPSHVKTFTSLVNDFDAQGIYLELGQAAPSVQTTATSTPASKRSSGGGLGLLVGGAVAVVVALYELSRWLK